MRGSWRERKAILILLRYEGSAIDQLSCLATRSLSPQFQDLLELATGYDEDVAAIACYDIGEFVRHYPNGRAVARRLGARDVIMRLIEHDNPELQRQALQCISKMLLQNRQVSSQLVK
jgi:hypothetical protein